MRKCPLLPFLGPDTLLPRVMHDPGERGELPHVTEINLMSLGVWGVHESNSFSLLRTKVDFYKIQHVR